MSHKVSIWSYIHFYNFDVGKYTLRFKNNVAKELDRNVKHMVMFEQSNVITISKPIKIFSQHQNLTEILVFVKVNNLIYQNYPVRL